MAVSVSCASPDEMLLSLHCYIMLPTGVDNIQVKLPNDLETSFFLTLT
jgi:hypothetical protein